MMRSSLTSLLAGAGLFALGSTAFAADIPMDVAPIAPAPMVAPFSWTGLYLGVAVGGGFIDYDTDFFGVVNIDGFSGEGWLVEGTIGFDYQMGAFVVGALADVNWSNIETEASIDIFGGVEGYLETEWGFDALLRAGFLLNDRALLYAVGGYSWQNLEAGFDIGGGGDSEDEDLDGWTIGAGIEAMLTDSLSVKGEYRYTMFDEFGYDLDGGGDDIELDPSQHTVRLGVNYKFNGLFQ
jgi:outer membrane immunogenic protein